MAEYVLATLAHYETPETVVTPDGLSKSRAMQGRGTHVFFESERKPRGFRSVALGQEWTCTARFSRFNREGVQELLELFENAYLGAEGRIIMNMGGMQQYTVVVEVHGWQENIREGTGITEVAFTATEVRG